MKKVYLLCIAMLCIISLSAQVKMYQFPSETFDEKTIEGVMSEARKSGTAEWELKKLEDNLQKRLAYYRDNKQQIIAAASRGIPNTVQQACSNVDFEQGNYNGWTLTSGNINGVTLPCNTCATTPGGIANITTSTNSGSTWTNGIDQCSGKPVVAPGGGNFSLCLNDNTAGGKMQQIQQTFQVTNSNNIFTFQYLAVLEDGGSSHSASQQPYFLVEVLDQTNNVIPCTYYYASGASSITGWTAGSCLSTNYKGWVTITIDLSAYNNQNVTIKYIVSDCNLGGHYGYAYIDGQCGSISYTNNAGICSGASAQLCGPPGYATYTWNGPQTGSQQCLTTSTPGTYTLATTSSLGCPSPSLTYTVTQAPAPTANFSVATQACNLTVNYTDISTVNGGTLNNWSWNFGDGQTATSTTPGNTQTHTYGTPGTYTVVMTCTTTAGCVASYSVPVTLSASLGTTSTVTAVNCNGGNNGSATIYPAGGSGSYTYTWSPVGGNNQTASNLPAGNYTVAVSDGAGCNTTTVVTISQPTPVTASSTFTASTCGQSNGAAGVTASGGTGPYTYTWSPSGGNGATASGLPAASYTCNITDSKGCPFTQPVTVSNTSGPSLSVLSTTSITCNGGNNGAASVSGTGGAGTLSYNWQPSGGGSSTAGSLAAGTYTCTVTDGNGCSTNTVVTINQPAALTSTNTFTPTACGLSNGQASVNVSGGTPGYTYTWTPSGGNGSTATGLGAGSFTCTVTDANGCTKQVPIVITTSTGPSVNVTASASVTCNGGNNGSATINASGGGGTYTYTWVPSGGNNTTASGLSAGSYTCVVSDQNGCLNATAVTINEPSPVTGTITPTNVSCNGGSNGAASISASGGTGTLTYSWVPNNASGSSVSGLGIGNYTCTITDAQGCTGVATVAITQPPALSVTIGSNSVTCNGGANGTATVTVSGGTNPYFYNWFPSGGSNSTAIGLGAGTYTCAVTDSKGCITGTVTTVAQPAAMTASYSSTDITCNGLHNGSATVTVGGGNGTTYTYSWTPSGGSSATATNLAAGSYTCTATDMNGCTTNTVVTINQPAAITGTTTVQQVKCSGASDGSALIHLSGGTNPYTVSWSTSPVQTGTTAIGLSEGSYTATVTDANGCVKKKTVVITAPAPKDTLTATGTLCATDPTVLLTAPNGGTAPNNITGPYQWYQSNAAIAGATSSSYTADQANLNTYLVTWFYHNCRYKTTTMVETIYADVATLPQTNIFTPNEDQINDQFVPFSFEQQSAATAAASVTQLSTLVENYELYVYDRWGKEMFHTTDVNTLWDGKTEGGKDCADGTYYWILKYKTHCNSNKQTIETKGFVQLLR